MRQHGRSRHVVSTKKESLMCYQERHKACLERNKQTIFNLMSRFSIEKAVLEYCGFAVDVVVNGIADGVPTIKRVAKRVIVLDQCAEYHTEGLRKVGVAVVTRQ